MGKRVPKTPALAGGGVPTPGVLELPKGLSRGQVQELRFQTNQNTVGDALTEKMMGLNNPASVSKMAEVLSTVMRDAESGDMTAANTYGRALQRVMVDRPDIWNQLATKVTADPVPEVQQQKLAKFGDTFHRALDEEPIPDRGIVLQDTPETRDAVAEMFPSSDFDTGITAALADVAAGSDVSAVPAPAIDRADVTADQFPFTKAMYFGGSERAKNMNYDARPASAARELYGPLFDHEVIRQLAQESGLPFMPAAGGQKTPDLDPRTAAAIELIERDLKANRSFRPTSKIGLRERLIDAARANGIEEGRIPFIVQQAMDRAPVSKLSPGVGDAVRGLLLRGEGPLPREIDSAGNPVPVDWQYLPISQSRLPTYIEQDRPIINRERSPLAKNSAAIEAATYGESPLPRRLEQILADHTANSTLRDQIAEAKQRGTILDLDKLAPWWRNETMIAPHLDDLGLWQGQLPPEILATLIRQSMLDNDPKSIARLVDPVRQSMNLLNQIDPSAANIRALYRWRRGQSPEPRIFRPNASWAEAVNNFYRHHGVPVPAPQVKPVINPKNIPQLNQSGSLRLPSRLAPTPYRTNPLTSLIG